MNVKITMCNGWVISKSYLPAYWPFPPKLLPSKKHFFAMPFCLDSMITPPNKTKINS